MRKLRLELDLTPDFIELTDSLRGDTPLVDFLSQCMHRGFIAALKEARPDLAPNKNREFPPEAPPLSEPYLVASKDTAA